MGRGRRHFIVAGARRTAPTQTDNIAGGNEFSWKEESASITSGEGEGERVRGFGVVSERMIARLRRHGASRCAEYHVHNI